MPSYWIVKTEPSTYSYGDLAGQKTAVWDGVKNNLALKHLRQMQPGDRVLVYHTGDEKAVVGIARAAGAPYPDPADKAGKLYAVDVVPVKKLKSPVTLAAIKADKAFASFPLVRISRLSVMPVSDEEWERIEGMADRTINSGSDR